MTDSLTLCDKAEKQLLKRIEGIYSEALKTAIKTQDAFFKKIAAVESGAIQPPNFYVMTGTVDQWREGFVREALRQQQTIDKIMSVLNNAGGRSADLIQNSMVDIYRYNRAESIEILTSAGGMNITPSFSNFSRKQIKELITQEQGPFSKIAYRNMGQNTAIRRALQNEMAQATALGESQRQIIERIRKVTGQSYNQAKRVAQTERTRVQSAARNEVLNEAQQFGLVTTKTWSCRFVNSRDTHMALDGTTVYADDVFVSESGAELRYPGDSNAPAEEVINCHCVMIPGVITEGHEKLESGQRRLTQ